MSSLTHCYALLVMVVMVAAPMAVSQNNAFMDTFFDLLQIRGTLYCTLNGNMGFQGLATPTFPGAVVDMRCGSGTPISSVSTNSNGTFTMQLGPLQILMGIINNCNLVVTTPLSNCDVELPSFGSLVSPLESIGSTILGLFNITTFAPSGFQFLPIH